MSGREEIVVEPDGETYVATCSLCHEQLRGSGEAETVGRAHDHKESHEDDDISRITVKNEDGSERTEWSA